jgi:hypothetical protein
MFSEWSKHRSYETLEMAEKNKADMNRKLNTLGHNDDWQFEIRIKDD